MSYMRMGRKLLPDMKKRPMFITHQTGIFTDELIDDWLQGCYLFIFNRNGPHGAMTLSGYDRSLFCCALASFVYNTGYRARITENMPLLELTIKYLACNLFRRGNFVL